MEDKFTKIYEKMLLEEAQKASELQIIDEKAKSYKHQRLGHKTGKLSARLATVKKKHKSTKEIERLATLSAKRERQKQLSNQIFNKDYGDLNDSQKQNIKNKMKSKASENAIRKITLKKIDERKSKAREKEQEKGEEVKKVSSDRKQHTEKESKEHKEEKAREEKKEAKEIEKKKEEHSEKKEPKKEDKKD